MSTAIHTLNDSLSWTCPIDHRPAARRSVNGAANVVNATLISQTPPISAELINFHTSRAKSLRAAAFKAAFARLLGTHSNADGVEL